MAASFEEFESLVQIVCNRTSSVQVRQNAEQRMSEIQNDDSSWHILLNFLTVTDDSLLFFIGQGLTGIAWRSFSKLDPQEQNIFTEAITQTLVERKDISTFARSKIEQVLAAICASSCSLNPVTSMVVDITQPGFDVGISALRTVFEEVLKDDPRIPPDHHKALLESSAEVLQPLCYSHFKHIKLIVCCLLDCSPFIFLGVQCLRYVSDAGLGLIGATRAAGGLTTHARVGRQAARRASPIISSAHLFVRCS